MRSHRKEGRKIYYLDESFVNCGLTAKRGWFDTKIKTAKQAFFEGKSLGHPRTTGKGRRLIIAGVMSEDGFVPDTTLLWESGHKDPLLDYHGEMNHLVFEEWLQKEVLPRLEQNSVLVIGEFCQFLKPLFKNQAETCIHDNQGVDPCVHFSPGSVLSDSNLSMTSH